MPQKLKIIAYQLSYGIYRASTKVTAIFFTAIVVTAAGGAYTLFSGNGAPTGHEDERFPSSVAEKLPAATYRNSTSPSFRNSSPPLSMPADFNNRTYVQDMRDTTTVEPVSVIEPAQASAIQGITSVSPLSPTPAAQAPESETTATSTSTSTSEPTGLGVAGTGGTSTATSTVTSTSNEPVYFSLSANSGWNGVCHKITMDLWNTSFVSTATSTPLLIALSAELAALYSDSSCVSSTTSLTIPAGYSTASFYILAPAGATSTIRAAYHTLSGAALTVSTGVPLAEFALGQPDLVSNTANNGGASESTLNTPFDSVRIGDALAVSDTNNHRVLIWTSAPTSNGQAADLVLGQPDFSTVGANTGGLSESSLNTPRGIHTDGTRLFVADSGNNRVLVWNSIPTQINQDADMVLGQPDLNSDAANNGGPTLATMQAPAQVFYSEGRLLVTDQGNHRVLMWNSLPSLNGTAASIALGQPDDSTITSGTTAAKLFNPHFAIATSNRVYISDFDNNRVLIYTSLPSVTGAAAQLVLGQPDFTSGAANNGGISAASMSNPGGIHVDSRGRLFVADYANNRVLVWNAEPNATHASAESVIGQSLFTTNAAGATSSAIGGPWGISSINDQLWVTEFDNHRVTNFLMP